jgi:16S rRNA (cytidine1402-2'-O)-methyltransferase
MTQHPIPQRGSPSTEWAPPARTPAFRAEPGCLYVVATPIGNLRDVTLRALDILASVRCIAAEDTRVSSRLLEMYGLGGRNFVAVHEHNERDATGELIARLARRESVALVTDAGTPGISDPGARVVAAVRAAGYPVVPVPGPSALTAALSVCGFADTQFTFIGFLPERQGARLTAIERLRELHGLVVAYETPHRIGASLADLARVLGGERRVLIAREITKQFESIGVCSLGDAAASLQAQPQGGRGEYVLVIEAAAARPPDEAEARRLLAALLDALPPTRAAQIVANLTGMPRQAVYALAMSMRE